MTHRPAQPPTPGRDDAPSSPGTRVAAPADGPYAGPVKAPPWDPSPAWRPHVVLHGLAVAGAPVADYVDGSGAPRSDAPRPHLHPVRTLAGIVVSDDAPRDHTWHTGIGFGVQDVAGNNLWGGRTYVRGAGYTWLHDHGRIRHDSWSMRTDGLLVESLTWLDAEDRPLLAETRSMRWGVCATVTSGWTLEVTTHLTTAPGADRPLALGSPGSHGRAGGGYGGFFWRLPACSEVDVRTPVARGEAAVHGSVPADGATWVGWSACSDAPGTDPARATTGAEFTVAVCPVDSLTARDPWFVRAAGFPGIGSAFAWDSPLVVGPTHPVRRGFRCLVADDRLADESIDEALRAGPS